MTKFITLLFCSLTLFGANAQKLKTQWGSALKSESKYYDPSIAGEDEKFLYTWDLHKGKLIIEKIDKKSLKRKYRKTLGVPEEGKTKYTFEGMSFVDGNYILYGSTYNRKRKKSILKAFAIDSKTGKYGNKEVLFENDVEKKSRRGNFTVYNSKHGDLVMLHYVAYYKKQKHTKEQFKLLNGDLEILLEREEVIEGRSRGNASAFFLDDEGSVYFKRNSEIVVFDANQDYEEWSQPIELDELEVGAFVQDFRITLNTDNDMILVGSYYTTDSRKTNENKRRRDRKEGDTQVEGMFFMKIDGISKETVIAKLNKFSKDFIDQFKTRKDIKKGRDTEINSISGAARMFFKEDGGIVMVSERYYYTEITNRNGVVIGERYYYSDLLAFNFAPDGELVWANRIPKSQLFYWQSGPLAFNYGSYGVSWFLVPMQDLNHYSYVAGLNKDNLYIVFNDHPKNKTRKKDSDKLKMMKNVRKSVPTVFTINLETGNKTKKVNLSLASGKLKLKPSTFYQKDQTEPLYVLCAKKKNYRFGKLDLNQSSEGKRGRGRR